MVLSKLLNENPESRPRKHLLVALERFGLESGLYHAIKAKRLGTREGSPFQIVVNVAGRQSNLRDVGYGVSQSLPIIVQSILKNTSTRLLLQQPEVHLHPRAQAAMGTFFAGLVATNAKEFVIETHSDYLIDRVRQEVASKTLDASSVSILFFDKPGTDTTIHQLALDSLGNVVGAPPSSGSSS